MISYESSYSILIGHRIRNERIALGMTQSELPNCLASHPAISVHLSAAHALSREAL